MSDENNIQIIIDDDDNNYELESNDSFDFGQMIQDLEGQRNDFADINFTKMINYNLNYTVKQLLLICEYYGIFQRIVSCGSLVLPTARPLVETETTNLPSMVRRDDGSAPPRSGYETTPRGRIPFQSHEVDYRLMVGQRHGDPLEVWRASFCESFARL
jgi:hypothetical protein